MGRRAGPGAFRLERRRRARLRARRHAARRPLLMRTRKPPSGWVPLAAPLVWLVVFFLVPMLVVFTYSLATRTSGGGVEFGLSAENYARIGESSLYLWAALRSLRIAIIV